MPLLISFISDHTDLEIAINPIYITDIYPISEDITGITSLSNHIRVKKPYQEVLLLLRQI